jgi:hypothetical protein
MTTIAWDGTTLAGDTLGVIGETVKIMVHKLFRLADGRLYGGTGEWQEVLAVRDWLTHGGEKPHLEDFAGIVIDKIMRCWRLEETLIFLPILEPTHAIGSGRDFALAAMALGCTATDAVLLAAQFDVWTNTEVETLCLLPT